MTGKEKVVSGIPREWLEELTFGDEEPGTYPPEIVRAVFQVGLRHLRGAHKGRRAQNAIEAAEKFRRRVEINHIFRFLPQNLRERPAGQATKDAVRQRLGSIGIKCSEATLRRDYTALGGAAFLRSIHPHADGEEYKPMIGPDKA